jgi:hypothetical protein
VGVWVGLQLVESGGFTSAYVESKQGLLVVTLTAFTADGEGRSERHGEGTMLGSHCDVYSVTALLLEAICEVR